MEFGFDPGKLWIGRHQVDGDTLIYDPALPSRPHSPYVSLFSLNQLRPRSFPLGVVREQVEPVTDEREVAEALERYEERMGLREKREVEQQQEREVRIGGQRQQILDAHQAWFEERGLPYPGLEESSAPRKKGAKKVCGTCGIALDDFFGVRCKQCGVLCSCGSCTCTTAARASA